MNRSEVPSHTDLPPWCCMMPGSPDIKTGSPHIKESTALLCGEALLRYYNPFIRLCYSLTQKEKKSDYYSNNILVPQTIIHLLSVAQGLWTKRHWTYFSKITHGKKMELLPAQHSEKGTVRSEGKCNSVQCSQICGYLWHSCGQEVWNNEEILTHHQTFDVKFLGHSSDLFSKWNKMLCLVDGRLAIWIYLQHLKACCGT